MKDLASNYNDVFAEVVRRFKTRNIPTILTFVIESGSNGELEWDLGEVDMFEQTSALWDGGRLWVTACSEYYDAEFRTELPYYYKLYVNREIVD